MKRDVYTIWLGWKVYEFDCIQYNTSFSYSRRPYPNIARTIKADCHVPAVCVRKET